MNIPQISIACKFNKLLGVDKSDLFALSDAWRKVTSALVLEMEDQGVTQLDFRLIGDLPSPWITDNYCRTTEMNDYKAQKTAVTIPALGKHPTLHR